MLDSILPGRSPRVIFLGMQSNFSHPSLRALLEHGIEVCAVVVPAPQIPGRALPAIRKREQRKGHSPLPMQNTSVLQLAEEGGIPVWEVRDLSHTETVSVLAAYEPDVICVACFPQRISRTILNIPRLGSLNVHPSLLPANRGPEPLFWTFREGHEQTGVTIHVVDEALDSGDILAQEVIDVPDGISYAELEARCATRGGQLLAQTVWNLCHGRATRMPQDERKSSYRPFPSTDDFAVRPDEWSARHVYNFIRAIAGWSEPIMLYVDGEYVRVRKVISYSHDDTKDMVEEEGRAREVRCKVGWVKIV